MGILDTLTNVFTGQPAIDAAKQQQAYLQGVQGNINNTISSNQALGLNALTSGTAAGADALKTGIGLSTGYLQGSLDPALAALYGGAGNAASALYAGQGGGLGALYGGVGGATAAYTPLGLAGSNILAGGGAYSDMLRNALGLGGPAGNAAAEAAFKASPGYQFQLGQGLDALTRAANATGMGASGNTLQQALQFGQGLANTEYGNWLQNLTTNQGQLLPLGIQGLGQAATGQGNALLTGGTSGANIYTGTGEQLSNLLSNTGANAANLYTGLGTNLSNLTSQGYGNLANLLSAGGVNQANFLQGLTGIGTGAATNIAGLQTPTYAQAAQAELQGSKNLWNLGLAGAQLAAGGGLGGLGSGAFGGLTGGFMGPGSFQPVRLS